MDGVDGVVLSLRQIFNEHIYNSNNLIYALYKFENTFAGLFLDQWTHKDKLVINEIIHESIRTKEFLTKPFYKI